MLIPGGGLLQGWGGNIALNNWRQGNSDTVVPINRQTIDVAWWRLDWQFGYGRLFGSGQQGATRRRFIARDWVVRALIWFKQEAPPPYTLNQGDGLALTLNISNLQAWLDSFQPAGLLHVPYVASWQSPSGVVTSLTMHDSSEAEEGPEAVVFQEVTLEGDSNLFYVGSQDDQDAYDQYIQQIVRQLPMSLNNG